jgi:hypothetical protein
MAGPAADSGLCKEMKCAAKFARTLTATLWVLCGCTRIGQPEAGATPPAGLPAAVQGNVCERKLLTTQDMEGILGDAITGTRTLPGDGRSCEFLTPGFPAITVTVRPGLGRATVESWATGRMPLTATPLEGIGERAVWQADLHEVIAQRDDLLCDIQARGLMSELASSAEATQRRLGALCTKIFRVF